jgi:energy-coupling factor transporter ATP-binding protein EcfA2
MISKTMKRQNRPTPPHDPKSADPLAMLWTERYRPISLDAMALDDDNRKLFNAYIAAKDIPHLLLIGPPGSGKTTAAQILCNALECQVLVLNASSERGIDVVREKIGSFVTTVFGFGLNVVLLDEADAMTSDAQTALRNLIESYAEGSRFILTANYGHRIIGPLQSRCQQILFGRPPIKERYRILRAVLDAEGISATPAVALGYAERYPDMRTMLFQAQRAVLTAPHPNGLVPIELPPATESTKFGGLELLAAVEAKNWRHLRTVAASGDFDPAQGLRDLFWAIPDEHRKVGMLRHVVGRGVHESGFTPDPVVLFLAVCAEAMEGM